MQVRKFVPASGALYFSLQFIRDEYERISPSLTGLGELHGQVDEVHIP